MGKYQPAVRRDEERPTGPDPIWRGIGCFLIILIPVISFAAASVTIPFFQSMGLVPRELVVPLQTPSWLWVAPVVAQAFRYVFGRPGILAILVLTFVYIILLAGVISVFYAFMYRMAAPSRYGPTDAPPPRVKVKKYKR